MRVICTTPRAGGTWLARQLGFGLPCELLRMSARRQLRRLGYPVGNPASIRRRAERHGIKVHWDQVEAFSWLPDLEEALPEEPEYVFLTREDVRAQALSLLTAAGTGDYSTAHVPYGDFTEAEIDAQVAYIREGEDGWNGWFAARGIDPLRVTYEELVAGRTLRS